MDSSKTKIYSPVQTSEHPRPQFEALQMDADEPYSPTTTLTPPEPTTIAAQQPNLYTKLLVCVVGAMASAVCVVMLFSK